MSTLEFQLGGTLKFLVAEPEGDVRVTLRYDGLTVTAKGNGMSYTLPDDKQVEVQVSYVDAKGNPAKVDGNVRWDTSDSAVATVTASSTDSMRALIVPVGPTAMVQVTATADADLGQGTREIITTMDVEIVAGEAVAGSIAPAGEPQPIA